MDVPVQDEPVVELELVALDGDAPASLYEDDRGVVIGVDLRDPTAALNGMIALLNGRFRCGAWSRNRTPCGS